MSNESLNSAIVAERLASLLADRGQEYALGGAIALGFWSEPRGTVDVDITLFVPPNDTQECVALLQDIGCDVSSATASESLREHGFCRVYWKSIRVDVFLPIVSFYEYARKRRINVQLGDHRVSIWDAETMAVFKLMFFRRKDIADLEQLLRIRSELDRTWVRERILEIYGKYDPRLSQWDELVSEIDHNS